MSKTTLFCLIGGQPAPNLLPILHYRPQKIVFVYSSRTKKIKDNLIKVLKDYSLNTHQSIEVDAYDFIAVQDKMHPVIAEAIESDSQVIINLTGGTKMMSLAAFRLAEIHNTQIVYFQSEGSQSLLHTYTLSNSKINKNEIDVLENQITISDYLKAHGQVFHTAHKSEPFEDAVFSAVEPHVCEAIRGVKIGGALDIDLVVRCGNQVGVAEIKSGKSAERKGSLDQLNTACSHNFLGAYTKRFLILSRSLGSDNRVLAEAHNIEVIELTDERTNSLSQRDEKKLLGAISRLLNCKK